MNCTNIYNVCRESFYRSLKLLLSALSDAVPVVVS